jgi:hypothetical protein
MDTGGASDESAGLRTAKSCGPDAPTLASSRRRQLRRRGWQTSPVTRESAKETVKTIARGMPGDSGVTVVTTLVCFFIFAHKAAGASCARHSLRPLNSWANDSSTTRTHRAARMRWRILTSLRRVKRRPRPSKLNERRRKQSTLVALWIASRSPSPGGALAPTRWLAMTVGCLIIKSESSSSAIGSAQRAAPMTGSSG